MCVFLCARVYVCVCVRVLKYSGQQKVLKDRSSLLIKFFLVLFGGLGQGSVIHILPVKPFETVMEIKGFTNKI